MIARTFSLLDTEVTALNLQYYVTCLGSKYGTNCLALDQYETNNKTIGFLYYIIDQYAAWIHDTSHFVHDIYRDFKHKNIDTVFRLLTSCKHHLVPTCKKYI